MSKVKYILFFLAFAAVVWRCGGPDTSAENLTEAPMKNAEAGETSSEDEGTEPQTADKIGSETAKDAAVDLKSLQEENPDIYAWLYIPGTNIDVPVLQSAERDDFYESHNAYGEPDEGGAVYTELANLKNMCDFNTVMHGKTSEDGEKGAFADLYQFADPDFFDLHEDLYLYIEGNLLTYTVFAAYERENTSLLRSYDFTYGSGCEKFLEDMYGSREMGKNLREGWEEVTPCHFLLTLTTRRGEDPEKQFVVLAALVGDAAGTIDRAVEW